MFRFEYFVCRPNRHYNSDSLEKNKLDNSPCAGQGYGSIIPDAPHDVSDPLTEKLADKVGKYVEQYVEAMEKVINVLNSILYWVILKLIFFLYLFHWHEISLHWHKIFVFICAGQTKARSKDCNEYFE